MNAALKTQLLCEVMESSATSVECHALADLMEEEGDTRLAFCYRWMGWNGRRPGYRGGKAKKIWCWYRDGAFLKWMKGEQSRYDHHPEARLDPIVYRALMPKNPTLKLYERWEEAVDDLSLALERMQTLLATKV